MNNLTIFRLPRRYIPVGSVLLCTAILFAGCNAFGTGETGGESCSGTRECLSNADVALANQNYDSAVSALEMAMEENPDNLEVRSKLAASKVGRKGIDILDVKRVADANLKQTSTESPTSTARTKTHFGGKYECSVEDAEPRPTESAAGDFEPLNLEADSNFVKLRDNRSILEEVKKLLAPELKKTDKFQNLEDEVKATWFASVAFREAASSLLAIQATSNAVGGHIFQNLDIGRDAVYCAPNEEALETLQCTGFGEATEGGFAKAEEEFRKKLDLFGNETSIILEAIENIQGVFKSNIRAEDCSGVNLDSLTTR